MPVLGVGESVVGGRGEGENLATGFHGISRDLEGSSSEVGSRWLVVGGGRGRFGGGGICWFCLFWLDNKRGFVS